MEAFGTYLIKSSVWLTGFALVYALFLSNERFFTLNRIYLVSGILFSMIFPLFTWHYTVLLPLVPSVEISELQVQGIIIPEKSFNPQNLLLLAYLTGILYLTFRILRQTLPVFRIIRKSETQLYSSAKLIRTDAYPASFSFFSFVFVNPSIDETETNEIVNHELEHIRQQHWIDLLLFEILRTMQWFNPVCWLYGHLIRQNHEYLADERALQRSSNPAIYRAALLNQMFGGPVISLANSFNYSLNKKRFNMMKQTISSPIRKLKLLVVIPLIAVVFYAFAAPEYQFIGGPENQSQQKPLCTITKDKIDIPFTTQLQKSDLETVKTELAKIGMKIDYTSLDFTKAGNLKQISATVKRSDEGSCSFTSGELTETNYPTFRANSDGSFGVYFQKAVKGKVIAEDRKPLKGANIVVLGKTIGTVTDDNGDFKLIMTDDSPIVISYVGFETQKVIPDFEKEMIIQMKPSTILVEFGKQTSTTANKVQIDLNKSNALIMVDGKEITKSEMDQINPDKIESVSVLKDESVTRLYGEKGKNGVVKITMKKVEPSSNNDIIDVKIGYPIEPKDYRPDSATQNRQTTTSVSRPISLDGIFTESQIVDKLDPETFKLIKLITGETATKRYGGKMALETRSTLGDVAEPPVKAQIKPPLLISTPIRLLANNMTHPVPVTLQT